MFREERKPVWVGRIQDDGCGEAVASGGVNVVHNQSHCCIHNQSHCCIHNQSHCCTHNQSHLQPITLLYPQPITVTTNHTAVPTTNHTAAATTNHTDDLQPDPWERRTRAVLCQHCWLCASGDIDPASRGEVSQPCCVYDGAQC